jgi:hypothetical protein
MNAVYTNEWGITITGEKNGHYLANFLYVFAASQIKTVFFLACDNCEKNV